MYSRIWFSYSKNPFIFLNLWFWLNWTEPTNLINIGSQYLHTIHKTSKLKQTPTSQPITLISPEMCFSFKDLLPWTAAGCWERERDRGRKRKQGRGERLDLSEQSGCNESTQRLLGVDRWCEWSGEERVNGVKSNCRQIVGLDNGLNGPYKPLNPLAQCECAYILLCICCIQLTILQPGIPYATHLCCNISCYQCWHTCVIYTDQ